MTSHPSNKLSDLKNLLAVNVNYSNSISRIFQNEAGVELFTKKNESSDIHIAPFETYEIEEPAKFQVSNENKENFMNNKRRGEFIWQNERNSSAKSRNKIINYFGDSNPNSKKFFSSQFVKEKEFSSSSNRYLLSEFIESSLGGTKVDPRWTKKEEIIFIVVCLIYRMSREKIKFVDLINFVSTRTKKQFYRHYYGNKSNIKKLSEIFFEFYKLKKEVKLERNTKQFLELHDFITKKLFNKGFIKYFNEKVDDEKCQKYFENIHAYITFEPRAFLKSKKLEKEIYNSPLPKMFGSKRNSSKEIIKNSNTHKSSSDRISSSLMLEDEVSVNNLTFKFEENLFNKLRSISGGEELIIDDLFLFEYAMKEF